MKSKYKGSVRSPCRHRVVGTAVAPLVTAGEIAVAPLVGEVTARVWMGAEVKAEERLVVLGIALVWMAVGKIAVRLRMVKQVCPVLVTQS